jgi:RHS repeat-associated protein
VQDAMTGLTYMQQRYYDPMIGRFLSVDPVTATSVGGNFNRYWYANDNPYSFTDPDGRKADEKYDPSKWKGRDWSQLSAHSSNGVTASARQISTNDIAVVQDRNAVTGKTTPVQSDSNVPTQSELQGIVDSINKAGDVLVEKSATEEVQNFNKMKIFLTLTDHGNDFAYATPMPNGDLVMTINYRRAMGKLNFNERVGKFLHEIRHFSARNIQLHDAWYARLREDPTIQDSVTNSYHEADAYQFQEKMGYPNNANH